MGRSVVLGVGFGRSGGLVASKRWFRQKWWIGSVEVLVSAEVVDYLCGSVGFGRSD